MGRTASIAPTWASACLPVPTISITLASCLAIQSEATPEMPPVRKLPSANASITATRDPSSALQSSSSGQVPPCVCVHVLVPTRFPSLPPIACRLFFPYCSRVFVMFCASPLASSRSAASRATIASFKSINWTTSASVIQIASAPISDLERGQHLFGKQFLQLEAPVAHTLFECKVDECLKRGAVLLQPIGPDILPEQGFHALGVGRKPSERRVRSGDVGKPLDRAALRFVESLVKIHREPGVALEHVGLDHDHVHDRKDPGLPEVGRFDRFVVRKQPPDPTTEAARGPCGKYRIDIPCKQHVVQRMPGLRAEPYSLGQLQLHLLHASRFVHARLDPLHRSERHPGLVNEVATGVDHRRLCPLRNPDTLALQLLRTVDLAAFAHVDHRLPERARRKHGYRGDAVVLLRAQGHVLAHGHFRYFPFLEKGEPKKRFLRRQGEHVKAHALDRHLSRSEEHTSELQSQSNLVCRLLLEKKKKNK